MKKLLVLIIVFAYFCKASGERPIIRPLPKNTSNMTVVDTGYMRIWYAFNALDIHKPETYDDMQRLEIGSGVSKYFSHFVYNNDSLITDWGRKNRNAQSAPKWMGMKCKKDGWSEYSYSEYFKDFRENVFTEYSRMPFGNIPNYLYTEVIPTQNWEIREDTLSIAGFLCQKAICTFRGRSYTAWFAQEIPISNGPWKFGGLPGLILKVYDKDKLYQFECVRIESPKQKYSIKIYDDYKNYRKTGRREVLKLQKEIHDDYVKVSGIIFETPPPRNETPYRPLELE